MKRSLNFPLIIGTLLISLSTFLAIWGPNLAPRDPLERTDGLIWIQMAFEVGAT